ncbi:MAG: hypothetical protein WC503_00570 [Candidatus Shapirobacteria bacterium]
MVFDHINKSLGTETLTFIEPSGIEPILNTIREYNPQLIVEMGTFMGGLSKYFVERFPKIPVFTFDAWWLISPEDAKIFREANVSVVIGNAYKNNLIIPYLLQLPTKKVFVCDGGCKITDFKEFAGYLRAGDLLFIHDWTNGSYGKIIEPLLWNFDPHPINKVFDEAPDPFISDARFFIRKSHPMELKAPNDIGGVLVNQQRVG